MYKAAAVKAPMMAQVMVTDTKENCCPLGQKGLSDCLWHINTYAVLLGRKYFLQGDQYSKTFQYLQHNTSPSDNRTQYSDHIARRYIGSCLRWYRFYLIRFQRHRTHRYQLSFPLHPSASSWTSGRRNDSKILSHRDSG